MRRAKRLAGTHWAERVRAPLQVGDDVGRGSPGTHWGATRGSLWLPEPGDAISTLNIVFKGQKTTGRCDAWFIAIATVGDGSFATYSGNSDNEHRAPGDGLYSSLMFGTQSVKTRACDGDRISFSQDMARGDRYTFSVDIVLQDTDWSILHTEYDGSGPSLHGIQWLYCVKKADASSPEAQLYNWFLPPAHLNTIGCNPIVWDDTNTYPISWAGAFPLAQAFSDATSAAAGTPWTGTYRFETFPLGGHGGTPQPLASELNGTSFDPGEMPTYSLGNAGNLVKLTSPDLPTSVVAGTTFGFTLQALDAYAGGAGRFSASPYGRAIEGFRETLTEDSNYACGASVERGTSGIYDITGFKIKRAGLRRIRVHDRAWTGATPRLEQAIEVLPAAPAHIFFNAFPQGNVGSGELLRMCTNQTLGSTGSTDYDPAQLAALDASVGWHDKNGKQVIQVQPGLPMSFVVYDVFNNFCSNDSASQWTVSLINRNNYLGSPAPHLTGTLTQTAVNGLVTFPDVGVVGWGNYDLKIQGMGALSGIHATWFDFLVVPIPTVIWNDFDEKAGLVAGAPTSFKFHYADTDGNYMIPNRDFRIHVSDGTRPGSFTGVGDYTMLNAGGEVTVGGKWLVPGFFDVLFKNQDFTDAGAYSPSFRVA